jgi:hypothetical protein
MRTRIALVAIISVALITVSTLEQAATAQSAQAGVTSSSPTNGVVFDPCHAAHVGGPPGAPVGRTPTHRIEPSARFPHCSAVAPVHPDRRPCRGGRRAGSGTRTGAGAGHRSHHPPGSSGDTRRHRDAGPAGRVGTGGHVRGGR